ncbi:GatB/YqeY domain-containing protein, partial [Neisseria sp. P0015.S004]
NRYLPKLMYAEEIINVVYAAISETVESGMADMGKVMGVLKTRLAGKADMGEVN